MIASDNTTDTYGAGYLVPSDMPQGYRDDTRQHSWFVAPGPLAIAAVAVFGNESFFNSASKAATTNSTAAALQICQDANIPFLRLDRSDFMDFENACVNWDSGSADRFKGYFPNLLLMSWIEQLNKTKTMETAFGAAMFYANQAVLTQAAQLTSASRPIYTSGGLTVQKPTMAFASLVILSILILFEVAGLLYLAIYISRHPTWTNSLNAIAVAQLAASLAPGTLPPAGSSDERQLEALHKLDGHVGVDTEESQPPAPLTQRLVLGGLGPMDFTLIKSR